MKLATIIFALLLLGGCTAWRHRHGLYFLDAHEQACRLADYCGPNAGEVMIGDQTCYTNDVLTPQPIDNKDLKCVGNGDWYYYNKRNSR